MAPRRSWAKANSPYWSSQVASWLSSDLSAQEFCRQRDHSTRIFELWTRHLVSAEDLRKRAEKLQNLRRKKARRQGKSPQPKRPQRRPRYRYGKRTDSGPIALRAFWSMHVEALNWNGMAMPSTPRRSDFRDMRCGSGAIAWKNPGTKMDWRSLLHPSARAQLSSAANCARRQYRLTPEAVDGRSHRRSFTEEQKRAIVAETERPGVVVAQVCRRHGIATSMAFRWREGFGLTARKAPELALVEIADGAESEPPALVALCDLVRPPDGMGDRTG
ncbi:transposase [Mesorhizobium sp. M0292]|uniref:IS66 family insertion sequence element accessory protein TnpA n=1 Tax=Mesorhizobium sp. M0292 TaxID=2956929 RepID=UPI00333AC8B9